MGAPLHLHLILVLSISIPFIFATDGNTTTNGTTGNNTTTNGATNLIVESCNHTLYFDFCVKSLSSEHSSQNADLHGLAAIALRLASERATSTSGYISGLLDGTGDDSVLEQCLSDCSDEYTDAAEQLDDSTEAIDRKAYSDVNSWVSAAMADMESCEDGCTPVDEKKKAELVARNGDFHKMCSITLAFTNLLS